jgi:hypothetical protein
MRGAQREMTGWLIRQGYTPVGRWSTEADNSDSDLGMGGFHPDTTECMRQFKPGMDAEAI